MLLLTSFVVGCFSAWDYARYFSTEIWQTDLYFFVGKSINEFTQGALSVFTLGSLLFLFFDRDHLMDWHNQPLNETIVEDGIKIDIWGL